MYVIYHIASTMQVGPMPQGTPHTAYAKTYKTRGAALRTAAKFNARMRSQERDQWHHAGHYGVASVEHYKSNVVRMVTRRNLISGIEYQEPSNTPGYCSPSSEAYWTR